MNKIITFILLTLAFKIYAQESNGCIDSTAVNFESNATISDSSCFYFCENTENDIIYYQCDGSAHPISDSPIIYHQSISPATHIDFPTGLCYQQNPPSSGPHRSMWGKWGEYLYMPPQRYLHNLEHGGIVFLYHPCVNQDLIDSLRNVACSVPDDETGAFRYILTPYPNLQTNIAVISWGKTYLNNDFNSQSINEFINEFYRTAPEDFGFDGTYDNLFVGRCINFGCTDSLALNFDSNAEINDSQCLYDESNNHDHDESDHNDDHSETNQSNYLLSIEIQNQIDSIMTLYPNCTDYPMNILIELDSLFQVLNSIDFSTDDESINSFDNSVISDPILYDYLLNNFDGIFSGGSIDTSISNNIDFLNLDNLGITSIEGLEYFTNLETLYVNNNELNELHGIPESLKHLRCRNNNLSDLHHFTDNMTYLDARGNNISAVIGIPDQIETLYLCFNDLVNIDFPDSLKYFLCASNNLESLPEFPENIIQVLVQNNNISNLPEIPESMLTLTVNNNNLTYLPNIPETLQSLNIFGNPLECVNNYPQQFQSQLDSYPNCVELRYSQIIEAFQVWYISINLLEGWNLIGYSCPEQKNIVDLLQPHIDKIKIVKDYEGNAYLPEWSFNGIGELQPGFGYQIKLLEPINNFSVCDWYQTELPQMDDY